MKKVVFTVFVVLLVSMSLADNKLEKSTVEASLMVPDTAWNIQIVSVYQVGQEIWVISQLSRDPNAIAPQMITKISSTLEMHTLPDLPVQHYVLGKTWKWGKQDSYHFIKSIKMIERALEKGTLLLKGDPRKELNNPARKKPLIIRPGLLP